MSTVPQNPARASFLLNRSRIAGDLIELFLQDFRHFNELGERLDVPHGSLSEFAGRLLRYVIDGDGPVLDEIKVRQGWPVASVDNDLPARRIRWRIYDRWERLAPQVLIRFARILAASSPAVLSCPRLDLSRTAPWVEALARDLAGLPVTHEMFWRDKSYEPHRKASISRLGALMEEDGLHVTALFRSAFSSVAGRAPDGCDFLGSLEGFGAELAHLKPAVADFFRDGGEAEKLRALSLLAMTAPEERAPFAEELLALAADASPEVREAALPLANALPPHAGERVKKAVQALASDARLHPPRIEVNARTSTEARAILSAWFAEANDDVNPLDVSPADGKRARDPLSSGPLARLAHEIESAHETSLGEDDPDLAAFKAWLWSRERKLRWRNVVRWMAEPSVQPIHVARLLAFTGQMRAAGDHSRWTLSLTAASVLRVAVLQCGLGSLLEFAKTFEALGAPSSLFVAAWYGPHGARLTSGWPAENVWPFFVNLPEALEAGFDAASPYAKEPGFNRLRLFDALALLPELPADVLSRVVKLTLAPSPQVRGAAVRMLQQTPGAVRAAIERLTAWLYPERNEEARDAILTALEALGDPIERHLSRDDLARDAVAELAKRVPAALAWFPFAQLPAVHWTGDGEAASPEIIQWLVIQAHRLRSPQPGPMTRRCCQMFQPVGREALGAFILGAWMANDLSRGASGVGSRGVLALVAACGGAHVAAMTQQYLRQWRNLRPAQCRALLQMLAATSHPASLQLLLSAPERFPAKGLHDETAAQARALAAREGWTSEDLNDRAVPWLGLDETASITILSNRGRLVARLTESLDFEPVGAGEFTSETLSSLRAQLGALLARQKARLYEAMCGGRVWPFEDWSLFLRAHPVMRFYCRRLVWGVAGQGEVANTFRPLNDGSLAGPTDAPVEPPLDCLVTLAHDCNIEASTSDAWRKHFRIHELSPLFPQFGRGALLPSPDQFDDVSLDDCEGVIIDTLKLRDAAMECGYSRGPEEPDGWCFSYVKRFPALAIEAAVEFTGDQAPEHNRYVALRRLTLRSLSPAVSGAEIPLAEVPPILLSECWNDLRQIAASGSAPAA
jgi:hypothetical protein